MAAVRTVAIQLISLLDVQSAIWKGRGVLVGEENFSERKSEDLQKTAPDIVRFSKTPSPIFLEVESVPASSVRF